MQVSGFEVQVLGFSFVGFRVQGLLVIRALCEECSRVVFVQE